uniref:RING-type domain-containing protein n=1 Tax=Globisporangium ultimum (strain ATCC 200006 / CBS 805.95 / DAOM BR144) TaxID=431595 RepID=K3WTW5_GLOUD
MTRDTPVQMMRKSMSLPPRPPAVRHRASLQETGKSFSSKSFSKRRLERHSSFNGMQSQSRFELSLLEHVQVEFVKAFVPANKLSQPRYVMRITNVALGQSWEMGRTFKEFHELKEAIVNVMDHGHFCPSNCPWIYMYVSHHFPRRHLFRSRSPSVISARLTELQKFLTDVLRMSREKRSLDCSISSDAFPRILYDFLFEGMVFDPSDFNNTALEDRMSFVGGSRLSEYSVPEESCSICRRSLIGAEPTTITNVSPPSSNAETTSSHSTTDMSDDMDMQSLTTLECGHVFHDECILAKLNEHLQCPLCVDPVGA